MHILSSKSICFCDLSATHQLNFSSLHVILKGWTFLPLWWHVYLTTIVPILVDVLDKLIHASKIRELWKYQDMWINVVAIPVFMTPAYIWPTSCKTFITKCINLRRNHGLFIYCSPFAKSSRNVFAKTKIAQI